MTKYIFPIVLTFFLGAMIAIERLNILEAITIGIGVMIIYYCVKIFLWILRAN